MISVVIPVYNERESLRQLYERLAGALRALDAVKYEILFVDDGSTDGSYQVLAELHALDPQVKVVRLRTNFGKAVALSVGFEHARGDRVVTLDGDLQDDPKEIPRFLEKLEEGYDLVSGWKFERHDPPNKTIPSRIFNRAVALLTGLPLHDVNCGFKAYRREVVESIRIYGELHRFIPVLARWKGFRVAEIKVEHHPRRFGRSKYGAERFVRGFLDLLTVLFLTRYLKRPLHLFGGVGLVCLLPGLGLSAYFGGRWLMGQPMHVRPLMVFGWVAIILGVQFISLGLLGEMLVHSIHSKGRQERRAVIASRLL